MDISEVLSEVKKTLATVIEETGAAIEASGLPVVAGDTVPLTHLFQNLISNALKYRSEQPQDQAVVGEALHGVARRHAADPEFRAQLRVGRQALAGRQGGDPSRRACSIWR